MGNDPCEGKMSTVIPNDGLSSGIAAWNRRAPAQLEARQAVQMPEPWGYLVEGRIFIGRLLPQHVNSMVESEGLQPTKLYTEQQVRAMLSDGDRKVLKHDETRMGAGSQGGDRYAMLTAAPTPPAQECKPSNERWICLLCKSAHPSHHGTLDDRVTPCPNEGKT